MKTKRPRQFRDSDFENITSVFLFAEGLGDITIPVKRIYKNKSGDTVFALAFPDGIRNLTIAEIISSQNYFRVFQATIPSLLMTDIPFTQMLFGHPALTGNELSDVWKDPKERERRRVFGENLKKRIDDRIAWFVQFDARVKAGLIRIQSLDEIHNKIGISLPNAAEICHKKWKGNDGNNDILRTICDDFLLTHSINGKQGYTAKQLSAYIRTLVYSDKL